MTVHCAGEVLSLAACALVPPGTTSTSWMRWEQVHQNSACGKLRNDQFVPKCANCGGQHSTNYIGCPIYKTKVESIKNAKPAVSFRPQITSKVTAIPLAVDKQNFSALPSKSKPRESQNTKRRWGPPREKLQSNQCKVKIY